MRLFIAVPVEPVQERVGQVMNDLASIGTGIKWVKPANLHLTMQFLGETPEDKVAAIHKAMQSAASGRSKFELRFGPIGAFPSLAEPRVIWIGLAEGAQALADLAGALGKALTGQGLALPDEGREFKAHLTIGRVRGPKNSDRLPPKAAEWPPEKMALPAVSVDRLVLFESRPTPGGVTHCVTCTTSFNLCKLRNE